MRSSKLRELLTEKWEIIVFVPNNESLSKLANPLLLLTRATLSQLAKSILQIELDVDKGWYVGQGREHHDWWVRYYNENEFQTVSRHNFNITRDHFAILFLLLYLVICSLEDAFPLCKHLLNIFIYRKAKAVDYLILSNTVPYFSFDYLCFANSRWLPYLMSLSINVWIFSLELKI